MYGQPGYNQQPENMGMQPQMMNMQPEMMNTPQQQMNMEGYNAQFYGGYNPQMYTSQLRPDEEQRFQMIDTDRSGNISAAEVSQLYEFQIEPDCALSLIHAINGTSVITRNDFGAFDAWMMKFNQVFMEYEQGNILPNNCLLPAIQACGLMPPMNLMQSIIEKFAPNSQVVTFAQFVSIASYVMLCGRILQKFDTKRKGSVTIDYSGMLALGLWFV